MTTNKNSSFISAVLYIHTVTDDLLNYVKQIRTFLQDSFEKYEIICVNDSTNKNLKEYFSNLNDLESFHISIVNMSGYQGEELAMNAGVDLAIGDFVLELDRMENILDKDLLSRAFELVFKGNDIVAIAPKRPKGVLSSTFYRIYNSNLRNGSKIQQETMRIISRRAINRINSLSKTIPYRKALYANCGLNTDVLYYDTNKRVTQKKKEVVEDHIKTALDSLILFTNIATNVAILLCILLLVFTLGVAIYVLYVRFGTYQPVEGWTTLMLFLSAGFSGVFLLFVIVLKYLSILIELVFKKKRYLVESIEKLS